jgi:hypothetical protein
MPNEADTCRKFVVPKLQSAGWDNESQSIAERLKFTDVHILIRSKKNQGRKRKRADYLVCYPLNSARAAADYTAEKVRTLCASPDEQTVPAPNGGGVQGPERGINFPTVATQAGKPEADAFDLLCHLAFNAPVLTRR